MSYFVQYSDETQTRIVGIFSSLQPLDNFPFQGEVDNDDPRLEDIKMVLKHLPTPEPTQ